jgi:hypothetical protein
MGWNKVMVMVVVYVVAIDDGVLFFAVERALCWVKGGMLIITLASLEITSPTLGAGPLFAQPQNRKHIGWWKRTG